MSILLFTGFEPFGKWDVNPTAEAAREFDGERFREWEVVGKVLPLRYEDIRIKMTQLVKKYQPSVIINSGQADGISIRLEEVARNFVKTKIPYNCGTEFPEIQPLVTQGDETLTSRLPLTEE